MEIKIGKKTYKSGSHNMKLLFDLTKLRSEIDKRYRVSMSGDTDEIQKLLSTINPCEDIEKHVKLVCRFFGNQFTEKEFMEGYRAESMQEFNTLIELMTLEAISGVTDILGEEKKPQTQTSKKESK